MKELTVSSGGWPVIRLYRALCAVLGCWYRQGVAWQQSPARKQVFVYLASMHEPWQVSTLSLRSAVETPPLPAFLLYHADCLPSTRHSMDLFNWTLLSQRRPLAPLDRAQVWSCSQGPAERSARLGQRCSSIFFCEACFAKMCRDPLPPNERSSFRKTSNLCELLRSAPKGSLSRCVGVGDEGKFDSPYTFGTGVDIGKPESPGYSWQSARLTSGKFRFRKCQF